MISQSDSDSFHPKKAAFRFLVAAISFVLLPKIILSIADNYSAYFDGLHINDGIDTMMVTGILIAIFSASEAFLPKSSLLRMIFGINAVACTGLFFFKVIGTGRFAAQYGQISMEIDYSSLAVLIFASILLTAFVPLSRFISARNKTGNRRLCRQDFLEKQHASDKVNREIVFEASSNDEPDPPPPEDILPTLSFSRLPVLGDAPKKVIR